MTYLEKYNFFIGGHKTYKRRHRTLTHKIFVAHDFFGNNSTRRGEYRSSVENILRAGGYKAVYAPKEHSGTILETLTRELVKCDAGIFDLAAKPDRINANVLIELGICLAINHPAIVIAPEGVELPEFLENLAPFRYPKGNTIFDTEQKLCDMIKARIEEKQDSGAGYCVICRTTTCGCRSEIAPQNNRYLLIGDEIYPADHIGNHVPTALQNPINLGFNRAQIVNPYLAKNPCEWLRLSKTVEFALFYSKAAPDAHHGQDNAATMFRLGLTAGSSRPWQIILPVDEYPPTDVLGYIRVNYQNPHNLFQNDIREAAQALRKTIIPSHEDIFDRVEQDLEEIDFNKRIRELEALRSLSDLDQEIHSSLLERLKRRRQKLFNVYERAARCALKDPKLNLTKKIAALDEALDPKWVIEEKSQTLRRIRRQLANSTEWSETKSQAVIEYIEDGLKDRKRAEDPKWLRSQQPELDVLSGDSAPNEEIRRDAEELRKDIVKKREELENALNSRVGDRNYTWSIVELRNEPKDKPIEDSFRNIIYENPAKLILAIEIEYAEYANEIGAAKLTEVLKTPLSTAELLQVSNGEIGTLVLNPTRELLDNRASIELGLANLLPVAYPHFVKNHNLKLTYLLNPNPKRLDANTQKKFEAQIKLLIALLERVEDVEKWEKEGSLDSLLKMYAAWPARQVRNSLNQKTAAISDDLHVSWQAISNEYRAKKLLSRTEEDFYVYWGEIDTQLSGSPLYTVVVAKDHPYYEELHEHQEEIKNWIAKLHDIKRDYDEAITVKEEVRTRLDNLEVNPNQASLKEQLDILESQIKELEENKNCDVSELRARIAALRSRRA